MHLIKGAPTWAIRASAIAISIWLSSAETPGGSAGTGGLSTLLAQSNQVSSSSLGCKSMIQVAGSIDELSVLASILNATGLSTEFNNPTLKGTLFAPTNSAIMRYLPQPVLNAALAEGNGGAEAAASSSALQALVLLHAVPSALKLQGLQDGMMLPSFLSSSTQLNNGKGLLSVQRFNNTLTGAAVQYAGTQAALIVSDIEACESVVHIVDNLLLPKPTSAAPSFQPSPQDVLAALKRTGETAEVSASGLPKFIAAPTAEAAAAPTQSAGGGPAIGLQQPLSNITLSNLSGSPNGDSGGQ